ncbi:MAG: excinuclease ABC subunit UvrA [Myxococcales bacterium]|nr:excinuclease ABC subunit UvrA [Myxococcales bacterium]
MPRLPRRTEEPDHIVVEGAREHNLAIDYLEIPKRRLVVFTGVSGSGKSSLAFDTLYAEGQRRYVESLSSYARQFLGQMEKPRYEHLRGLSPTIAIEQKSASSNPRSTVGTVTEVHDYLRVLYARAGEQRCHLCGGAVAARSAAEIVDELAGLPARTRCVLLAPKADHRKGEFRELFDQLRKDGYSRVRIDGMIVALEDVRGLEKQKKHTIEVVVDRVTIDPTDRARLADGVETAAKAGGGRVRVLVDGEERPREYSEARACPPCGVGFPELTPQALSFNSPLGMCEACNGLGTRTELDPDLVITDPDKSIAEGAVDPWRRAAGKEAGWTGRIIAAVCREYRIPADLPWRELTDEQRKIVLHGADRRVTVKWDGKHGAGSWAMRWEGVANQLERRLKDTQSEAMRTLYQRYFRAAPCRACAGQRLRPESRAVLLGELSLTGLCALTVGAAAAYLRGLRLEGARAKIASEVLKEVNARLGFLLDVGLEYLTLDRSANSLSGGEAQRIRLASQLGSELSGVMYVLDEPSIGLHQRDNAKLLRTLERLRDLGNSVIVVEHDAETIEHADHVIDFGPGAGRYGGRVVAEGPPAKIRANRASPTGRFLAGLDRIEVPATRRQPKAWLELLGAREHNLRNLDVRFPLGVLCAITGVSGAGKSSLIGGVLRPALRRRLSDATEPVGAYRELRGADLVDKVIDIDQKPIGRTPRSNPATYSKAFDHVRDVFAMTAEARTYGYAPGRFSFNVKGGRCEACAGDGLREVEMHFLPNVYVTCEICRGKRYNDATLRVKFRGKTIAEVLDTSITEALELFANVPPLRHILKTLDDVGLGYLALGQSATTLSGGEAQRVKLARELARRNTGRTLYFLDEPTTGLHFADVKKLLEVLERLVASGNSVIVVEHNLDVVKTADWVIDLGPEGGAAGGALVAEGTPEAIARATKSYTGQYLAPLLGKRRGRA